MKKQNVRTISLIVCVFTFLLVGAAIFDALESDHEAEDLRRLMMIKNHFINKYNITHEDFRNISVLIRHLIPHNSRQWKFAGAFYYCVTAVTTIGYGHSTPRTWGGKVFTMFYVFIGIPLGLVMFQSIGERLNVFATFLLANIKKCFRFKNAEVSQTNLIVIDSTLVTLVVSVSAAVFDHYESWGYLNAVYYCIITLTTVGFGDLVPLQTGETDLERRPEYVVFTLVFILFGLTVVSANMNLLVLRFMTVNSDDERRDEMEAAVAALTAVKVDGDVIFGNEVNKQALPQVEMKAPSPWPSRTAGLGDFLTPDSGNNMAKASVTTDGANKAAGGESTTGDRGVTIKSSSSNNALTNGTVLNANSTTNLTATDSVPAVISKGKQDNLKTAVTIDQQATSEIEEKERKPLSTSTTVSNATFLPSTVSAIPDKPTSSKEASKATTDTLKEVFVKQPPPLPPHPPISLSVSSTSAALPTASQVLSPPSLPSSTVAFSNSTNCIPSVGKCAVPNCRHQFYCQGGSLRNPADACSCSCHQDKAWWSYLLKTMPNSNNNSDSLATEPKHSSQRLQLPKLSPHNLLTNTNSYGGSISSEQLPLIPPPSRHSSVVPPPLPSRNAIPELTETHVAKSKQNVGEEVPMVRNRKTGSRSGRTSGQLLSTKKEAKHDKNVISSSTALSLNDAEGEMIPLTSKGTGLISPSATKASITSDMTVSAGPPIDISGMSYNNSQGNKKKLAVTTANSSSLSPPPSSKVKQQGKTVPSATTIITTSAVKL